MKISKISKTLAAALAAVIALLAIQCAGSGDDFNNPLDKNGTNYLYGDTTNESEKIKEVDGVSGLYRKYCTITFNANGGTVNPTSDKTGTDGKLASLPTPTRSGYNFNGWYTAETGGTKVEVGMVYSANTTIYAQWNVSYVGKGNNISNYRTVTIGNQMWMAENLDYDVPSNTTDVCYNNSPDNCVKYGRLYNWNTALMACPAGWHLPSDAEWTRLTNFVGGLSTAGIKLKSKTGWYVNYGTNDYGFSALPGGFGYPDGRFYDADSMGNWWSSTSTSGSAWLRHMGYINENVRRSDFLQSTLYSVRCLEDDTITTFVDSRDSKTYRRVTIGTQTWMAENLNYRNTSGSNDTVGVCYNNSVDSCAKYGRLYDWSTAMGIDTSYNRSYWSGSIEKHQGVCPVGWHLPNDAEWTTLTDYIGGASTAGTKLKSQTGWYNNGNGTDQYGFFALPGGKGYSGSFDGVGYWGFWWSTKEDYNSGALNRCVYSNGENVSKGEFGEINKSRQFSVRCLQDW